MRERVRRREPRLSTTDRGGPPKRLPPAERIATKAAAFPEKAPRMAKAKRSPGKAAESGGPKWKARAGRETVRIILGGKSASVSASLTILRSPRKIVPDPGKS